MSDMNKPNEQANSTSGETLSLNDDRRVKTLSPGALVVKRFFRNRLAVLGLVILAIMFLFSFVGGMISPYREDEQFYTYTYMEKEYVGVTRNEDFRYVSAEGADFGSAAQAQFLMAQMMGKTEFDYKDVTYGVAEEGKDFYSVSVDGSVIAIAYKDIVNAADNKEEPAFNVKYEALKLYTNDGTGSFTADGMELSLDEDGNILQGEEVLGYISRFVVQSKENGVVIPRDFKESLEQVLDAEGTEFAYTGEDGEEHNYTITYDASTKIWSAFIRVVIRWAIKMVVPWMFSLMDARIFASVSMSTAERESSNTLTGVSCMSIRAMATRCFCPPEMVTPRSPIGVSYPWAKPSMASSITAIRA